MGDLEAYRPDFARAIYDSPHDRRAEDAGAFVRNGEERIERSLETFRNQLPKECPAVAAQPTQHKPIHGAERV